MDQNGVEHGWRGTKSSDRSFKEQQGKMSHTFHRIWHLDPIYFALTLAKARSFLQRRPLGQERLFLPITQGSWCLCRDSLDQSNGDSSCQAWNHIVVAHPQKCTKDVPYHSLGLFRGSKIQASRSSQLLIWGNSVKLRVHFYTEKFELTWLQRRLFR